jgi:thymidylate kinase
MRVVRGDDPSPSITFEGFYGTGKTTQRKLLKTCKANDKYVYPCKWSSSTLALREGKIVLADRYFFTSNTRDGARRINRTAIANPNSCVRRPDTLLFALKLMQEFSGEQYFTTLPINLSANGHLAPAGYEGHD